MRVLVVDPGIDFSVGDVYRGLVKGLRSTGEQVATFGVMEKVNAFSSAHIKPDDGPLRLAWDVPDVINITNQMLRGAVLDTDPDLIVVVSGFFVNDLTLRILRARGKKVVAVMTEQPYELTRELRLASKVDGVALNDPTHIDAFREVCPNVWYQPHAFDPDVHYPGTGPKTFDAWWCGTGYESRRQWLEAAVKDPRWPADAHVGLAGNWKGLEDHPESPLHRFLIDQEHTESCVRNTDTADGYRTAAMSWNTYRKEAETDDLSDGWAMGPREVELAACGTFFARESRPEGDALFPMLPIIDDPREFGDVLRWSMDNPEARADAAMKAREAVSDRTFDRTAAELLRQSGL